MLSRLWDRRSYPGFVSRKSCSEMRVSMQVGWWVSKWFPFSFFLFREQTSMLGNKLLISPGGVIFGSQPTLRPVRVRNTARTAPAVGMVSHLKLRCASASPSRHGLSLHGSAAPGECWQQKVDEKWKYNFVPQRIFAFVTSICLWIVQADSYLNLLHSISLIHHTTRSFSLLPPVFPVISTSCIGKRNSRKMQK